MMADEVRVAMEPLYWVLDLFAEDHVRWTSCLGAALLALH